MPRTLIPAKAFGLAKQRLSHVLDGPDRAALAAAMLARTIGVAKEAFGSDPVVMVTQDDEVAKCAIKAGADRIVRTRSPGLNAELAEAADTMTPDEPLLVLHADLPRLSAEDLRNFANSLAAVTIATDRHAKGTNALLLRTADRLFAFGPGSRLRHEKGARERGLSVLVLQIPGLAHDLDDADDWRLLRSQRMGARQLLPNIRTINDKPTEMET